MTDFKHIIEPERIGLWAAVAFVIALLALVTALVVNNRTNDMMAATQLQILMLNKKIEDANKQAPAAVPEMAPAAEAVTPEEMDQ
jgi:hypothetical protein